MGTEVMDVETLKKAINENIVQVRFEKKDGTIREMICSLNPVVLKDLLPDEGSKESTKKINEDVLAVFDLDKKAWRSFRLDSVQTWEII